MTALRTAYEIVRRPMFSMEYVEGQTLSDVCAAGAVSAEQAARYLMALAEAVDDAHEQGILHRDLKPSNVLVDTSGRWESRLLWRRPGR